MKQAKNGFVPALGTPLDADGGLMADSYEKQIEAMIQAGAAGLLSMGSMGQQAFIRSEICVQAAETAVKAAGGRVPVYVGAMDNSIARARARIASMEHLDLTAFVLTTPYYEIDTKEQVLNYFRGVAGATGHGIILYDLPGVTKFKITYDMVCALRRSTDNLIGIKSADQAMLRKIRLNSELNMQTFYSGLDTFDVVFPWGIGNLLDGMFSCSPVNAKRLMEALNAGDRTAAAAAMDNIISFRDLFIDCDIWPAYSAAMNLLGFEGFHCPDWCTPVSSDVVQILLGEMVRIGELS